MLLNRARLLQKKRKRGRPRSKSAPASVSCSLPLVRKTRKHWTNESMVLALEAVKRGTPVLRAAVMYNIPRQTLYDRVNGRVIHGSLPGPSTYLSNREESELAEFIVTVAEKGFGKTRQQIKGIAEKCAHKKGALCKDRKLTDGWYQRFMQRQAHLSLRRGDATAAVRMDGVSREIMDRYFELLKEVLVEHNILNDPSCIYNVDETGMPLEPRPPKVVTARGQKKVRVRTSGNKAQITVVVSVNATGNTIPPFVIFDAKNVNLDWTRGEVPGTAYAANSSGWIDSNLFKQWLSDHFLKHAVAARPLFLLLDGHSSHYQPDLIKCAQENNVILFCLPPHTTHETQPLDVSVFKPLKSNWQECCHKFIQQNPGRVVTKYQFSELFKLAWNMTMTPQNICAGFEKSGIYPFNPQAVKTDEEGTTNFSEGATTNDVSSTGDAGTSIDLGDTNSDEGDQTNNLDEVNFTPEQMQLYQKRYDEGYDIPDPEYLQWVEIYYPGFSSNQQCELTVAEHFSYIEPCTPITVLDSTVEESSDINTTKTTNPPKCTPEPATEALVSSKIQPSSGSEEENELKYISKFLVQFVPTKTKVSSSQTSKRVSGAKVLTSGECAAIIEERGKNKKQKEQEKEERKTVREEKKREKEEIAKKKAEENKAKKRLICREKHSLEREKRRLKLILL